LQTVNWENSEPDVVFDSINSTVKNTVEVFYSISENFITSSSDWIGLYDPKAVCSDEYITYQWAKRVREFEKVPKTLKLLI
jgi:hypothetical protein